MDKVPNRTFPIWNPSDWTMVAVMPPHLIAESQKLQESLKNSKKSQNERKIPSFVKVDYPEFPAHLRY